jgi:hypothetical protein
MGWHLTHALALIFAAYPPLTAITLWLGQNEGDAKLWALVRRPSFKQRQADVISIVYKWPLLCTVKNRKQ